MNVKSHLKPDPVQQQWLFEQQRKGAMNPNPCARMYGVREGKYCKECRLLLRKVLRSGKVFFKCSLVGDTNGPGTDFRANWTACMKFVPRQQRERTTAGNKIMYCE